MIQAGAIYEGQYFLGTTIARPLIAKRMVEIAQAGRRRRHRPRRHRQGQRPGALRTHRRRARARAAKSSPRGARSASATNSPAAPEMIAYCEDKSIPVQASAKKPYSMDRNLLHISFEAGILEDPWFDASAEKARDMYVALRLPRGGAGQSRVRRARLRKGPLHRRRLPRDRRLLTARPQTASPSPPKAPPYSPLGIMRVLNKLGGKHGVGRVDMVENRFVGMKSRGVYETPGGAILHFAHRQIESLTMDREVMHLRDSAHPEIRRARLQRLLVRARARGAAGARHREPEERHRHRAREALQGQHHRRRPQIPRLSLYNPHIATMEADPTKAYNQDDATGFIAPQRPAPQSRRPRPRPKRVARSLRWDVPRSRYLPA